MAGRKPKARDHFWATVGNDSNECMEWPFAIDGGYGRVRIEPGGKPVRAHVAALELMGPPRPSPNHEVAHNCGNPACYNWRHLRWAERSDNLMDRAEQGRSRAIKGKKGFLSRGDVFEIANSLMLGETRREIAERFGCTRRLIDLIAQGKRHAKLTGFPEALTGGS